MMPTGVSKGCEPAEDSTPLWWGMQAFKPEQLVPGAAVADGLRHFWLSMDEP